VKIETIGFHRLDTTGGQQHGQCAPQCVSCTQDLTTRSSGFGRSFVLIMTTVGRGGGSGSSGGAAAAAAAPNTSGPAGEWMATAARQADARAVFALAVSCVGGMGDARRVTSKADDAGRRSC
jgi:hypothetical protein